MRFKGLPLAAIIAMTALCLALVGCGGTGGSAASGSSASAGNAFAGTWELDSMDDSSSDELEAMKELGYNMFFVLDEDGSATYEFLGSEEEGTYEPVSATEATLKGELTEDNWTETMKLDGDTLVLESVDGGNTYFKKITEEQHQAYNEEHDLG